MDIGDFTLLAGAIGLGAILRTLLERLLDRRKGRLEAEQSAWEQRDSEARQRRRLEEALHATRHQLRDHGVPYEDMPPWPSRNGKT